MYALCDSCGVDRRVMQNVFCCDAFIPYSMYIFYFIHFLLDLTRKPSVVALRLIAGDERN